jgi:ABC-2 type transport system ATP-binding protein
MIHVENLVKHYGPTRAVNGLTFDVRPGVVTGFLGPNGSGKSTTMRMIVGLDRPTAGTATIDGKHLPQMRWLLHEVGALLEAKAVHPGRSARNHLLALAQTNGISRGRVDEVLEFVGLASAQRRRAGKFSLGMGQRLGIACALLGDPQVLLFDEPVNGLDPEGILWVRNLLKDLASQGRTVLVSSHLMSEMALTATDLVVIGRGELIAATTVDDFIASNTIHTLSVRSADQTSLSQALSRLGAHITPAPDSALLITDLSANALGDAALAAGIALYELTEVRPSLEDVFMELTADSVEYHGGATLARGGMESDK